MEIVGRREQPRVLAIGVPDGSELAATLATLAPTVRFLKPSEIAEVRQGDWDAAVLWECDGESLAPHLLVIQFGGAIAESIETDEYRFTVRLDMVSTVAVEYVITDESPSAVRRLLKDELAPEVIRLGSSPTVSLFVSMRKTAGARPLTLSSVVEPFLVDGDGKPVAGRFRRLSGKEWWLLPEFTPHPERWVAAAFEVWASAYPDLFPSQPNWAHNPEWMSDSELTAEEELHRVSRLHLDAVRNAKEAVESAQKERSRAALLADENERRLITSQGDELVSVVAIALRELGFDVQEMDKSARPGDLLEDLRVADPTEPSANEWLALVEVRGYAKGAQVNDLLRIGRFVRRYQQETGGYPSAQWYVVNHFLGVDPSARPEALASNPNEVATFGQDGGLVIDTRDLFRLWMRVRRGTVTSSEARAELRAGSGRLHFT